MKRVTAKKALLLIAQSMMALLCTPLASFAQEFPVKPIRIVASQNPGGTTDATARAFAAVSYTHLTLPTNREV